MPLRDLLTLLGLAAIWGGAFPLLRIAAPAFGPVALIAVRVAIAAAALLAVFGWRRELRTRAGAFLVLGLLGSAVPFTLFAYATLHISAGFAALLNATTPMFGALLAVVWLRERLDALRVLGILIGFAGVGMLVWDSLAVAGEGVLLGIAAGLLGAALYAVAAAYARRQLGAVDPAVVSTGALCAAAVALLPLAPLQWPRELPAAASWVSALVLGLVCTAAAYLLYFRLLQRVGLARATTVTFLIPVFGILWGALLLGERIGLALLLSCGLVLLGTALAVGLVPWPLRRRG